MTATGAMRFGCCGGIADAPLIHDAGFDYIELPVGALMSATDDAAFRRIMENVGAFGIPVEACNVFIPASLKITGPTGRARSALAVRGARLAADGRDRRARLRLR